LFSAPVFGQIQIKKKRRKKKMKKKII